MTASATTRALVVTEHGPPSVLAWQEVERPAVGAGEVLVAVDAFAVNWSDLLELAGAYPGGAVPPFATGHDACGRVLEVGPDVVAFAPGDRVFGTFLGGGAAAEEVVGRAEWLHRAPDSLSDVEAAATAAPFFSADAALVTMGRLQAGDTVLVHAAAGGFGSAAVQLARAYGAGTIIGTAGGPARAAAVRELGADLAVDYLGEDFVARVAEATGGRGVDLLVDSVGGDVLERSFDCVTMGGRMVCVGATEGRSTKRFRLQTLFELSISVAGFTFGDWVARRPDLVAPVVDRVLRELTAGTVKPVIGGVFEPDRAAAAFEFLRDRRSVGRTVVRVR